MPTKSTAPDAKDRGVHTPVDTEAAEEGDEASADEGNADDIENTDADVVADAEEGRIVSSRTITITRWWSCCMFTWQGAEWGKKSDGECDHNNSTRYPGADTSVSNCGISN